MSICFTRSRQLQKTAGIIIFLFQLLAVDANAQEVVVKYSFQDCMLCNLGVRSLSKISVDSDITIVFKEQEDKEGIEPVQQQIGKLLAGKRHKFVSSDSLFYALDLSNFSRVLVVDSSKLLYAGDLKNFSARNVTIFPRC